MENNIPKLKSLDSMEGLESTDKVEIKKLYLLEGVEKWSETVKDYWVNYNVNQKSEIESKDSTNKVDILLERFNKGVGEAHHRLASTIGMLRNAFAEKNILTTEQLQILNMISYNATSEGKIKRYRRGDTVIGSIHPIHKIYSKILNTKDISSEEFEILKKDAYDAGQSVAISDSLAEVLSWVNWALNKEYILSNLPIALLRFRKGDIDLNQRQSTDEENTLLSDAIEYNTIMSSSAQRPEKEILEEIKRRSNMARSRWAELYFSENFQPHSSFLEYINEPSK
jgi:hypothetical protein